MQPKQTAKQRIQNLLETHGGKTADKTQTILLKDPTLQELKPQLEFIQKNWRDPLRPALMKLACDAVGGDPTQTEESAAAISLMNLSFYLWDDIIDSTTARAFKPTTYGKYGQNQTIILAGIATAKAYTILTQARLNSAKREATADLLWNMWTKMATAETTNLKAQTGTYTSEEKLAKIETEAHANLETCLKIGALIGNASKKEADHLAKYGHTLGVILDLQTDTKVTLNLTLELTQKIARKDYTYTMLIAKEDNPEIQKTLNKINNSKTSNPLEINALLTEILATNALNNVAEKIKKLSKDAAREIVELKKNSATGALLDIARAQPLVFRENLHN